MDDGLATTFTRPITVDRDTILTVVYTNEESTVGQILAKYERLLAVEEHKFMGLDLEYTRKYPWRSQTQEIAVVQLSMGNHVLVYHYCRYENRHAIYI